MNPHARLALAGSTLLALSGCLHSPPPHPSEPGTGPADAFDGERLFFLHGCDGVELTGEWLGPHGPNGPAEPPASWKDPYAEHEFTWSLEVLACDRLGWGPLERGPVWVGIEFHNAYNVPAACRADLEKTVYPVYLHSIYLDAPAAVDYATSWAMPVVETAFSAEAGDVDGQTVLRMVPRDGAPSTITLQRAGALEDDAADIMVAFFWFNDDGLHRLTLYRDTRVTVGDVAVLDMSPPTIMGDSPIPQPARASWLSNLNWSGDLVTFTDATCTARAFP